MEKKNNNKQTNFGSGYRARKIRVGRFSFFLSFFFFFGQCPLCGLHNRVYFYFYFFYCLGLKKEVCGRAEKIGSIGRPETRCFLFFVFVPDVKSS